MRICELKILLGIVRQARRAVAFDDIKKHSISLVAYNPGVTVTTSLSRSLPTWIQHGMVGLPIRWLLRLLSRLILERLTEPKPLLSAEKS